LKNRITRVWGGGFLTDINLENSIGVIVRVDIEKTALFIHQTRSFEGSFLVHQFGEVRVQGPNLLHPWPQMVQVCRAGKTRRPPSREAFLVRCGAKPLLSPCTPRGQGEGSPCAAARLTPLSALRASEGVSYGTVPKAEDITAHKASNGSASFIALYTKSPGKNRPGDYT
jgi:hypothetical protein